MSNLSDYKYPEFNEDFEGMIPVSGSGGGDGSSLLVYHTSNLLSPTTVTFETESNEFGDFVVAEASAPSVPFLSLLKSKDGVRVTVDGGSKEEASFFVGQDVVVSNDYGYDWQVEVPSTTAPIMITYVGEDYTKYLGEHTVSIETYTVEASPHLFAAIKREHNALIASGSTK